jgi:hypothetical protein
VKKTKTRTLLTNKKEAMRTSSKAGVRLEKIPESSLSKTKAVSVEPEQLGHTESNSFVAPITLKNQRITKQE